MCRLMLLEYCVDQRGDLEEVQQAAETMQSRRELVAQVFSAWRDCVSSQRRDGKSAHRCKASTVHRAPLVWLPHNRQRRRGVQFTLTGPKLVARPGARGVATQKLVGYGLFSASLGGGSGSDHAANTSLEIPRATTAVDEF